MDVLFNNEPTRQVFLKNAVALLSKPRQKQFTRKYEQKVGRAFGVAEVLP